MISLPKLSLFFQLSPYPGAQDHDAVAASYNNLAMAFDRQGDFKSATTNYELSLKIYEKKFEPNHPTIATTQNNIGMLC